MATAARIYIFVDHALTVNAWPAVERQVVSMFGDEHMRASCFRRQAAIAPEYGRQFRAAGDRTRVARLRSHWAGMGRGDLCASRTPATSEDDTAL